MQVAPAETQVCDITGKLADSGKRCVSMRSNKRQTPSRFATSGYLLYVCLIIFLFCISAIYAIPALPWSEVDGEEMPIVDNKIFWHPLERAILLSDYQLLIMFYKILFSKTSCGKFLCEGIYNATEILAPNWYLDWENEIYNLTNKALKQSMESNTQSIPNTIRHNRETRQIHNHKAVILSLRSVSEKNPHLFLNISNNWENITVTTFKYFTRKLTTLSKMTYGSTIISTRITQNYDSYKETSIINNIKQMIGEIEPPVLFEQYDEVEFCLLTHNQELVCSGRDRAAKLLCIQQISLWKSAENEIFRNELTIDVKRLAGVTSQFSTEYNRVHHNIWQWYLSRLEERNWQYLNQVSVNERDESRNITLSLPLPPMVMKLPINYNLEQRNTLIDYSFRLSVSRYTNIFDDYTNNHTTPPEYKCVAYSLLRLLNDRLTEGWPVAIQTVQNGNLNQIKQIF